MFHYLFKIAKHSQLVNNPTYIVQNINQDITLSCGIFQMYSYVFLLIHQFITITHSILCSLPFTV